MNKKKVSVIIPVYNVEQFLVRCLESVISQTYSNIEIIVVNDGSTDASNEICKHYANFDKRVKCIDKSNGGLSSARNAGLDVSEGKYIFFLDSDDFIRTDAIGILVNKAESDAVDIVSSCFCTVPESPELFIEQKTCNEKFQNYTKEDFFLQNISNHACGKLYKRILFDEVRFPEGRNYEDIATTFKLYSRSNNIAHTSAGLYFYRMRNGAITRQINKKNILDLKWVYYKVKEQLNPKSELHNYYLLTILYILYSRTQRLDSGEKKLKKTIEAEVYDEVAAISISPSFRKAHRRSAMYKRVWLLRHRLAKVTIAIVDFYRERNY